MAELSTPHFEGSKWVRRTPHFAPSWVRCDDEKSGCEVWGVANFRVRYRTPHRTRNVKRWSFRKQGAVRLKIAKVQGAMSKVRRTPHFFALRTQLGVVRCDDEKSGCEVRGAAHFRVRCRTPHRTRNVKRWGFQKHGAVRCGATQNCQSAGCDVKSAAHPVFQ